MVVDAGDADTVRLIYGEINCITYRDFVIFRYQALQVAPLRNVLISYYYTIQQNAVKSVHDFPNQVPDSGCPSRECMYSGRYVRTPTNMLPTCMTLFSFYSIGVCV